MWGSVPHMSDADTLNLSFFDSARDNKPKAVALSWSELADTLSEPRAASCTPETCKRSECTDKHGPAWSPASYPAGASRARGSVYEVCALVLDIDHVPTDKDAAKIIDRLPYRKIVHASHSDRPGDRCLRIIVALTRPVSGEQWPIFWQNVTAHLGVPVDQATKDASRLYFLPSRPQGALETAYGDGSDYLFASTDGPRLDPEAFLQDAPAPKLVVGPTPTYNGKEGAIEALAHAWPAQGRHQASLALCGALAHAGWSEEAISEFLAAIMAKVYPDGDPNPRKREEQARDSVAKVARQEPVSGWPSLIPHVTEPVVNVVTKLLNIGTKPQWLEDLVAKHNGKPIKPSLDQVKAHYKAQRARLLRQRTNTQSQYDARLLGKLLAHEQLAEGDEDRQEALVHALEALIRWAPEMADHDQMAQMLVHVFPLDIGQGDQPWSDTLSELLDSVATQMAEKARVGGDFEVEATGARIGKPKLTIANLEVALKKLNVTLRYDEFACKKLISINGSEPEVTQDRHLKGLWLEIERRWELSPSFDKWASLMDDIAYKDSFHPVRDYLDALEWDGQPRIHNWLARYAQAKDTEYTRAIGRIVLMAAVRRVRQPGCKFDEMLILEGEQGKQKSTALRALCPKAEWFTDDMPLHADSKKAIEATSGKWIIECGELKGMSKADIANLKGFLSRAIDEARMAFGREVRIAPRQWVPIGTTNDAQYLHDPTGLRRFWPVEIVEFDVVTLLADRDQLWAEAAHYESQGESIRLDPKYYAIAAQEQEERRMVDTIDALLEEVFAGLTGKIRVLDIYQLLGKDAADVRPDEQRRVGDSMRRLGWKHTRRRYQGKLMYYYVKGSKEEEAISLGVSGRKVVRVQDGPPLAVPLTALTEKAN